MTGKSWPECEVAGHIVSSVRKQKVISVLSSLSPFTQARIPAQGIGPPTLGLPPSIDMVKITPYQRGFGQRPVCQVIPDLIKLTSEINTIPMIPCRLFLAGILCKQCASVCPTGRHRVSDCPTVAEASFDQVLLGHRLTHSLTILFFLWDYQHVPDPEFGPRNVNERWRESEETKREGKILSKSHL